MASDRQQFRAALSAWDQHHMDGNYSVSTEQGALAILFPYNHAKHAGAEKVETFERLRGQTLRLADHIMAQTGRKPRVAIDASVYDFEETVTDPTITDIIVVGKGTFSNVEISNPIGWLGWRTLAQHADHLKTGEFRQIVCGSRRVNLNVPLGTFVVSDHQNIFAPIDTYLPARSSLAKLSNKLSAVADQPRMDWAYIKQNFSNEITYSRSDRARARLDRIEQHYRRGQLGTVLRAKLGRLLYDLNYNEADAA